MLVREPMHAGDRVRSTPSGQAAPRVPVAVIISYRRGMPLEPALIARTRAFVFDAYGTLFDVHSAVARHTAAIGPEAARLSETWRAKQLEYTWVLSLAGRYEPFWALTEKALDYALARCPSVDDGLKPLLLEAYRTLDAYPEVVPALTALRRLGYRTAILSNGDPGMLRDAVASAGLGDVLHEVISVDAAKVFKASPRAYELVPDALGVPPAQIMFLSSNRWDVAGATAFGFRAVWVNRPGLPDEYEALAPVATVPDLAALT
jgi:2-haloacid dehalogenase